MYEVLRAYPSHVHPGRVTVRFKDFDALGNRHLLDISNTVDLEFMLVASAFMIAKYGAGAFELLYNAIHEQELVERLKVAFEYLRTNPECSELWSIVKHHQEKVTALTAQYA
ncbi:MAG TPA: hypothetical protein VFH06_01760 [Candidatus Saccharimonadales bacterium]|nr:hypothetical protein [Candidatus Saccharimonadales bacterium]